MKATFSKAARKENNYFGAAEVGISRFKKKKKKREHRLFFAGDICEHIQIKVLFYYKRSIINIISYTDILKSTI